MTLDSRGNVVASTPPTTGSTAESVLPPPKINGADKTQEAERAVVQKGGADADPVANVTPAAGPTQTQPAEPAATTVNTAVDMAHDLIGNWVVTWYDSSSGEVHNMARLTFRPRQGGGLSGKGCHMILRTPATPLGRRNGECGWRYFSNNSIVANGGRVSMSDVILGAQGRAESDIDFGSRNTGRGTWRYEGDRGRYTAASGHVVWRRSTAIITRAVFLGDSRYETRLGALPAKVTPAGENNRRRNRTLEIELYGRDLNWGDRHLAFLDAGSNVDPHLRVRKKSGGIQITNEDVNAGTESAFRLEVSVAPNTVPGAKVLFFDGQRLPFLLEIDERSEAGHYEAKQFWIGMESRDNGLQPVQTMPLGGEVVVVAELMRPTIRESLPATLRISKRLFPGSNILLTPMPGSRTQFRSEPIRINPSDLGVQVTPGVDRLVASLTPDPKYPSENEATVRFDPPLPQTPTFEFVVAAGAGPNAENSVYTDGGIRATLQFNGTPTTDIFGIDLQIRRSGNVVQEPRLIAWRSIDDPRRYSTGSASLKNHPRLRSAEIREGDEIVARYQDGSWSPPIAVVGRLGQVRAIRIISLRDGAIASTPNPEIELQIGDTIAVEVDFETQQERLPPDFSLSATTQLRQNLLREDSSAARYLDQYDKFIGAHNFSSNENFVTIRTRPITIAHIAQIDARYEDIIRTQPGGVLRISYGDSMKVEANIAAAPISAALGKLKVIAEDMFGSPTGVPVVVSPVYRARGFIANTSVDLEPGRYGVSVDYGAAKYVQDIDLVAGQLSTVRTDAESLGRLVVEIPAASSARRSGLRVLVTPRDAQLPNWRISQYELTLENGIILPRGGYTIRITSASDAVTSVPDIRDVEIQPKQTTLVRLDGVNRVQLPSLLRFDGNRQSAGVSLRRANERTTLLNAYTGASIDIPAGRYSMVIDLDPDQTLALTVPSPENDRPSSIHLGRLTLQLAPADQPQPRAIFFYPLDASGTGSDTANRIRSFSTCLSTGMPSSFANII
ncbi:MAG: hypothetical protein O3A84_11365 [Proteobacteria bacterium]|nr:hypothetical protein [Pseudomonadota bacterium]